MALNNKGSGELILHGIGLCASTAAENKKNPPYVFVAYLKSATELDVGYTVMEYPAKQLLTANDVMCAIARAERVADVVYIDEDGKQKDICVCRETEGKVYDVIKRDSVLHAYPDGFAEIAAGNVKFAVGNFADVKIKPNTLLPYGLNAYERKIYEKGGYEYAIINAHNACLLSRTFYKEELCLETKSKKRVRVEVRSTENSEVNGGFLLIKPILLDEEGYIDHYLTEEFDFIDGETTVRRQYKITYTNQLNDYCLSRV